MPRRKHQPEPALFGANEHEPELLGLREYAQHRGVRQREVQDAIARGVLRASVHVRGDRRMLDLELADREWEAGLAEASGPLGRAPITAGETARAASPGAEGPTPMGLRAYARHRGVTEGAVRDAIARGRLARSVRQVGRRKLIDPREADREWDENTEPAARERPPRPREGDLRDGDRGQAAILRALEEEDAEESVDEAVFMRERAARERWSRRKERLQVLQLRGEMIERTEVDRRVFGAMRVLRDALRDLGDRMAPVLAPKLAPADVGRIIDAEIARALEDADAALAARVQADAG